MKLPKKYTSNIPLLALTVANVVPLFGAIFWGWEAFNIVLLYWAENLAVGFYNILKIAFAKVPHPSGHLGKLFLIPFFTIHYGGFTGVHGLFVLALFKKEEAGLPSGETWPCFLAFVQMLFHVIRQAYSVMSAHMKGALVALFLSHGVSFVHNYLLKGEFASARPEKLMFSPYSRIAVMHVAIIVGAFLTMAIGSPLGVLIVLIALKTVIDVKLHLWEHKKAKALRLKLGKLSITIGNDETSIEQEVTEIADKDALVVASKVKAYIKSRNMMTSSDAIATLNDKVRAILDKAVARAKANRRKTVKPHDL